MADIEIKAIQVLPTSIYKIGTGEDSHLRYGADLEAQDMLVLAIKANSRDPRLISHAIEQYLINENVACFRVD
jgi:hypothetical protein